MSEEELKPCPACGGESELEIVDDSNMANVAYAAAGICCECDFNLPWTKNELPFDKEASDECIARAIADWNSCS